MLLFKAIMHTLNSDIIVRPITKELATNYVDELVTLANLILQVHFTAADILAEMKGERKLLGKWEHSLAMMVDNVPIATMYGDERKRENNEQYPSNTLYIAELAVGPNYRRQGIARRLMDAFFERNNRLGFLYVDEVFYSL